MVDPQVFGACFFALTSIFCTWAFLKHTRHQQTQDVRFLTKSERESYLAGRDQAW